MLVLVLVGYGSHYLNIELLTLLCDYRSQQKQIRTLDIDINYGDEPRGGRSNRDRGDTRRNNRPSEYYHIAIL